MMLKLLIALVLMFLSRVFFYLLNLEYFSDLSFVEGLKIFIAGFRFDISAVLIINLPFILMNAIPFRVRFTKIYQGIANAWFYLINTVALMANFIDSIYFRFTLKRTTADIFNYLGVGGDFDKLIPQFIKDFWYVMLLWILFIAGLIYFASRFIVRDTGKKSKGNAIQYFMIQFFFFIIIAVLTIIGIRGGLQLRPISLVTTGKYTTTKNVPLLLNTPFAIAKTFRHESLREESYFKKEKELIAIYNPVHKAPSCSLQKMNVFIIIMESFSREHIGLLNHDLENGRYQGFTPFMDSLIRQGLYFDAYANGKTSIQGIPAILSSIPSLMNESFIQSNYAADKYTSIAGLLKPLGYTTAFFHGGTNGTMGFDAYSKGVGFDHYYGRKEYNNEKEYDGKWGIRDEAFFRYSASKINEFKPPFLVTFFSLSSHHPYYVPGKYANVFRKGKLPIQQSIMYADHSLREFFQMVRHMKWFENTLFVITADHTSEGYYPFYKTNVGQVAVPLLFYKPGSNLKGRSNLVAQQTDVMPTILDYLGYQKDYIAFGTNLFDSVTAHFSIHYISGLYGLIKDGYYLEFDGSNSTSLFDLKTDPLQQKNIITQNRHMKENLELFIKGFIQQYNNRVIENRMTIN